MKITDYKRIAIIINHDSGSMHRNYAHERIEKELKSTKECEFHVFALTDTKDQSGFYGGFKQLNIPQLLECDIAIVFGGDGTKNYVANLLIHYNRDIPLLGVSSGTMNVGKLTSIQADDFDLQKDYFFESVNALCVTTDDNHFYYAFHDVIIASTFVGTYDGRVTQLSAEKMLQGLKLETSPEFIGDCKTRIEIKRKSGINTEFPTIDRIGLIGIAELRTGLAANVLAGGADHPATMGVGAGVIMSPERFVWPSRTIDEYHLIEPVQSYFSSFDFQDEVQLMNMAPNAHLIIDGNALATSPSRFCRVYLAEKVIRILKPQKPTV